ncbi:MAG: hypothetical protein LQ352_002265 [Teloschistes flavicans]|nr:MAG: hypothetical protein LQ352_002265 [Teloschistes flavicans]
MQALTTTQILTLEWPRGTDPLRLPNFEREARRLRYQALGRACFEAKIPSLLLGHHKEDETETLLMRLCEGYRGEGLRGIPSEAGIPDCPGMYGVTDSGGREFPEYTQKESRPGCSSGEYSKPGFEYGGVKIYRPLMNYTKPTLQALLREAGIPWVEDPTNLDLSLSSRNAIRHLIHHSLLPQALYSREQPDASTLKIVSRNIRRKFLQRNDEADRLFQACKVIFFNAKSGYLDVRIPLAPAADSQDGSDPGWTVEKKLIAARLVRQLLDTVTPRDHISLQSLEFATKTMFFNVEDPYVAHPPNTPKESIIVFTAGNVLCRRTRVPDVRPVSDLTESIRLDPDHIWRLCRQPYNSTLPEPEGGAPDAQSSIATAHETINNMAVRSQSSWQLWDGRYWIQIFDPSPRNIRICPLSLERLTGLKRRLKEKRQYSLKKFLSRAIQFHAPGSTRHTLPAIVDADDDVLALPTLGIDTQWRRQSLNYRIRYRKVILPGSVTEDAVMALSDR